MIIQNLVFEPSNFGFFSFTLNYNLVFQLELKQYDIHYCVHIIINLVFCCYYPVDIYLFKVNSRNIRKNKPSQINFVSYDFFPHIIFLKAR